MNNFIQLLKPLKTPAKYLLYFFIAFVLFYLFGQPPEFRDEVTNKIRLYAENYINTQRNQRELDKFGGDGDYWVHLKRFQFRERAEKFSEEVQERGFQPKQYYGFTDETHPLMILIGPYSSKDEALKIVNRIRSLDIGEIDDKKTKKPRVSEKVDSEFGKIDNENLINFVFKSQRENLDSSKTIEEKIAFQNKLKKLMDQRGLAYRMGGIDMEAGLWSYSFLFPSDDDCYNTRYVRSHWGGEHWLTKYGLAHTPVGESEGNADSPYLIRSEKLGGGFFTDPCEDWDEGERRAQSLLKNAQEVVSGKETSGGMTEIKNPNHHLDMEKGNPNQSSFDGAKGYPDKNNSVNVKYKNSINGMKVDVIWEPFDSYGGYIVGEATIRFEDIKTRTSFSIYHSNFGVDKDKAEILNLEWDDALGRFKFDKKTIHIDNKISDTNDWHKSDIFFYDLDFDGNKELITYLPGLGNRGLGMYNVYEIKDGNPVYKEEEPYSGLDARSTIDRENKTISLYESGGACHSMEKIYRFKPTHKTKGKGKYLLEKVYVNDMYKDACHLFAYDVDQDRNRTLVSKENQDE